MRLTHLFIFYSIVKFSTSVEETNDVQYDEGNLVFKASRLYLTKPDILPKAYKKSVPNISAERASEMVGYFYIFI